MHAVLPDVWETERRQRERPEGRSGLPVVSVAAPGAKEANAFRDEHADKVRAIAQPTVVAVRPCQAERSKAEDLLEYTLRRGNVGPHLSDGPSAHDGDAAASVLIERLQRQVCVGVLLEVEERMAEQRGEVGRAVAQRASGDEQTARQLEVLVEPAGGFQERARDDRILRLGVVADQECRWHSVWRVGKKCPEARPAARLSRRPAGRRWPRAAWYARSLAWTALRHSLL